MAQGLFCYLIGVTLLVGQCYGHFYGSCGKSYDNLRVKPINLEDFSKLTGDWYVRAFYNMPRTILKNTKCVHYHYENGSNPNVIDIIRHERKYNENNSTETQQQITFGEKNVLKYKQDIETDEEPIIGKVFDYDVTSSNPNEHFIIYYSCMNINGKVHQVFMALIRKYEFKLFGIPENSINLAKRDLNLPILMESFINKYNCPIEDPNLTTTNTPTESEPSTTQAQP